jgi:hypothetical protein
MKHDVVILIANTYAYPNRSRIVRSVRSRGPPASFAEVYVGWRSPVSARAGIEPVTVGFRANARTDEENAVAEERGAQRSRGFDLPVMMKKHDVIRIAYTYVNRKKVMPGGVEGDPGVHRCVVGQRARLADRGDADVDALERVRWKRDDDAPAFVVHAGGSVVVVVVVVFTPRSRFAHSCVAFFVVLGGGGERREDGVGASAPAVFGAEHAARDEDDVGVVRYEQEPQEDQLVVQIALRAVGSRAVRGDER